MFEVSEKAIFSWRDGSQGGFKAQLFELWVRADLHNRARIVTAWAEAIRLATEGQHDADSGKLLWALEALNQEISDATGLI